MRKPPEGRRPVSLNEHLPTDKEVKTMVPVTIKRRVLPGEEGGDTAWFYRQNSFEQQEVFRQVAFKHRQGEM